MGEPALCALPWLSNFHDLGREASLEPMIAPRFLQSMSGSCSPGDRLDRENLFECPLRAASSGGRYRRVTGKGRQHILGYFLQSFFNGLGTGTEV